jgi:cyclomaltodextrinase
MSWHDTSILWHVYPLGFTGAPMHDGPHGEPQPRLRHLTAWFDYAADLGVTGLLLGPIFASQSHGYDSVDQFRVDPRLGTLEDFDELVRESKSRGLRIVLDGVFNHLGEGHPWFRRAMNEGLYGEYGSFFQIDWSDVWNPRSATFEGHSRLVGLNHDNPQVAQYVVDVMSYWMERGVDGWRLDAAYAVKPEFWQQVLPRVRERFPEAWFSGEVIHGNYGDIAGRSGMHSVTQYELWKAIWSSLKDRNFFELSHALTRHNDMLGQFSPLTFVGNHDVTRIATQIGPEKAALALTVLMTIGGTPSIYYGDEQAFTGVKEQRVGGDDAIRPAFPAHPDELAPWGGGMFRLHQELIAFRKQRPWLAHARTSMMELATDHVVYRTQSWESDDAITVELDLRSEPTATIRDEDGKVVSTAGTQMVV